MSMEIGKLYPFDNLTFYDKDRNILHVIKQTGGYCIENSFNKRVVQFMYLSNLEKFDPRNFDIDTIEGYCQLNNKDYIFRLVSSPESGLYTDNESVFYRIVCKRFITFKRKEDEIDSSQHPVT